MSTFGTPDKQQLLAIMRCRSDMAPLAKLFETTLEQTLKSLVSAQDAVLIHRLQGKAQVFKDFLAILENADQILERLK